MPQQTMHASPRRPNGDVDWYACGQRARREGRPIYANPGVGREAAEWRAGYVAGAAVARADPEAVPEFR